MKKIAILLTTFILATVVHAQEKLNALSAPTSPASAILGMQPKAVLVPKSYQALDAAIYSNFLNSSGNIEIPNNFSLEFTPYWAVNHGIDLKRYLYPEKIFKDEIIRNSSFSLASTQGFLLGDSTATNGLAFGYRTTIYIGGKADRQKVKNYMDRSDRDQKVQGKVHSEVEKLAVDNKIKDKDTFLIEILPHLSNALYEMGRCSTKEEAEKFAKVIIDKAKESLPEYQKSKNNDEFINKFENLVDSELEADVAYDKFKPYLKERLGWSVDFAYATILNFPTNSFGFSYIPKQSIWLTPCYRFKDKWSVLKLAGVFRYEWYNSKYYKTYFPKAKFYDNNLDYGMAIVLDIQRFSLQFEIVGRSSSSILAKSTDSLGVVTTNTLKETDLQYIGTFSYKINDQIAVTYSLGNRFEPVLNPNNTLVSILSLNFGFGGPTKKDLRFVNPPPKAK